MFCKDAYDRKYNSDGTLGSSFLAFPRSLDIFFVYLIMYLIDAPFRGRFLPIPEMVGGP